MLFSSKDFHQLNRPPIGEPIIIGTFDESNSIKSLQNHNEDINNKLKKFPLEPIVLVGGNELSIESQNLSTGILKEPVLPFRVAQSYLIGGRLRTDEGNDCLDYLNYCINNGNYGVVKYRIPTNDEMRNALDKLLKYFYPIKINSIEYTYLKNQIN